MQQYAPRPVNRLWCVKSVFPFKVSWPYPGTSQVDCRSHQCEASFSSVGRCHRSPCWKCPPDRAQTCHQPGKQHRVYNLQRDEAVSLFHIVSGAHVWLPVLVLLQQHLLCAAVDSKHRHEDQGVCSCVLHVSCYHGHLVNNLTWKYQTFYSLHFLHTLYPTPTSSITSKTSLDKDVNFYIYIANRNKHGDRDNPVWHPLIIRYLEVDTRCL